MNVNEYTNYEIVNNIQVSPMLIDEEILSIIRNEGIESIIQYILLL